VTVIGRGGEGKRMPNASDGWSLSRRKWLKETNDDDCHSLALMKRSS
jgi:hypothetical protein